MILIIAEKTLSVMRIASATGPDILIFNRFCGYWHEIDSSGFEFRVDLVEIIEWEIALAETKLELVIKEMTTKSFLN